MVCLGSFEHTAVTKYFLWSYMFTYSVNVVSKSSLTYVFPIILVNYLFIGANYFSIVEIKPQI